MSVDSFTFNKKAKPIGEHFVWATGMGLGLGLVMIVGLLGLILVKGVDVFWPKKVVAIELTADSSAKVRGNTALAGVITKRQTKVNRVISDVDPAGEGAPISDQEIQLFIGNKDVYGFSFKFLDVADIKSQEQPDNVLRIERLEYGDAFGYPVAMALSHGETISADREGFDHKLETLIHQANDRWDEIRTIEKKKIGRINHDLESIRLKIRGLDMEGASGQAIDDKRAKLEIKAANLQAKYEVLAAEARELRHQQTKDMFIYQVADGTERKLPIGQIVHVYYPNQLSMGERIKLFFQKMWGFLIDEPREANTEGGVFPAIFGTFVMTVLMSAAVTPFGVLAAIYLREYAKQGFMVRCVRIAVNNLAGVPSIVFGVFGLGFFVYFVGGSIDHLFFKEALPTPTFGTGGIIWASLTLALLTVPVVIVSTEEALASVPRGMREGSLACGASKWQTIFNIVLPASAPGILTGLILAMARGASEVAPLMLVGVVKLAPNLPLDGIFPFFHLERKFMHLGFHIYDLGFQSPDSEAAKPMVFATTLLLIALVVVLNLGAVFIRQHLRKKYATGAF